VAEGVPSLSGGQSYRFVDAVNKVGCSMKPRQS
jgi:hypothetical protein